MKIADLIAGGQYKVISEGDTGKDVGQPFCCDLLSIAMSKCPTGSTWVTIMGNINTIAVCTLTEAACVILAEGVQLDDTAAEKARTEGITVLATDKPIFETALAIYQGL